MSLGYIWKNMKKDFMSVLLIPWPIRQFDSCCLRKEEGHQ